MRSQILPCRTNGRNGHNGHPGRNGKVGTRVDDEPGLPPLVRQVAPCEVVWEPVRELEVTVVDEKIKVAYIISHGARQTVFTCLSPTVAQLGARDLTCAIVSALCQELCCNATALTYYHLQTRVVWGDALQQVHPSTGQLEHVSRDYLYEKVHVTTNGDMIVPWKWEDVTCPEDVMRVFRDLILAC